MPWLGVRSCLDTPDKIEVVDGRRKAARRPQIAVDIIDALAPVVRTGKESESEKMRRINSQTLERGLSFFFVLRNLGIRKYSEQTEQTVQTVQIQLPS